MLKKVKVLVEPLERLMTTLGTKGPRSNTVHSSGNSQITCLTKQQVSEIPKQIAVNNFANPNKAIEKTNLHNFLFENFSIFKVFSPQPVPIPVVFSRTSLRVCKSQGFGVASQYSFLNPVGTRNVIGRGIRNFSTTQPTMLNNGGGIVLSHLSKPFSAVANKSGSLWFKKGEVLDNNKFEGIIKKDQKESKKMGRKIFGQSGSDKGIFEIVVNSEDKNCPRIVRRSSIKKPSEKNEAVESVSEVYRENVQVYMSFILSSSVFWNLDDNSSNSTSSINSTTSVLSYLLQHRNVRHDSRLNSSFVQHLQEIAEVQHDHMMEVISILGILLRHGNFEVNISGCELIISFPHGMQKVEVENMLQSLGIDPSSSHFELEEFVIDNTIEFSPENNEGIDVQFPEPNSFYVDESPEILSCSSSINSSPVLLSGFNTPPRLGAEYISGIQEFLNAVDEALVRNTSMFNNREEYYEN